MSSESETEKKPAKRLESSEDLFDSLLGEFGFFCFVLGYEKFPEGKNALISFFFICNILLV